MDRFARLFPVLVLAVVLGSGGGSMAWAVDGGSAVSALSPDAQARDGRNRRVRVHNQTGRSWTQLQISEAGQGAWTGNQVNSRGLSPGASVVINFDTGTTACRYDLRAQIEGAGELIRTGVDVCAIADFYFTR